MEFTEVGKSLLREIIKYIDSLQGEFLENELIKPTTSALIAAQMLDDSGESLRQQLRAQLKQESNSDPDQLVSLYTEKQKENILICIKSLSVFFNQILNDNNIDHLRKFVKFIKNHDGLSILLDANAEQALCRISPMMTWRLVFKIIAIIEDKLSNIESANQFVKTEDVGLLEELNSIMFIVKENPSKRKGLYLAFQGCLAETEASLFIQGRFGLDADVVFVVQAYRVFLSPQSVSQPQTTSWNQYQLAEHSLKQLAAISKRAAMTKSGADDEDTFGVMIIPEKEEANMVHNSPSSINSSYKIKLYYRGQNHGKNYTIGSEAYAYKLPTKLKLKFEEHIKTLLTQMKEDPQHRHDGRRYQKYQALQSVINADDRCELSPETYTAAESGKAKIFLATGSSYTEELFNEGRESLQQQLWKKEICKADCIGKQGVSLSSPELREKLVQKLHNLLGEKSEYADINIINALIPGATREQLSGISLWRYDKEWVLKIILSADLKKCLHPALLEKVVKNYPHYGSLFWSYLKTSEVEKLCVHVARNVLFQFWEQASGKKLEERKVYNY